MLTKELVEEQVKALPSEFSFDELMERLFLVDKINSGLKDFKEGKTISSEDLEKEMREWFK
jgi:hypothetical protein